MGNLCALFSLHPPSILTCPHPVVTSRNLMLSFSNLILLIAPLPNPSPYLHPTHLTHTPLTSPSPPSPPHLTSHSSPHLSPLTSPLTPSPHPYPPHFTCRPTPPTPSSPLATCRCTTSREEGGWSSSGYPLTFSTATKRTLKPSQP